MSLVEMAFDKAADKVNMDFEEVYADRVTALADEIIACAKECA